MKSTFEMVKASAVQRKKVGLSLESSHFVQNVKGLGVYPVHPF